jgi:hypothetical protein
MPDTSKVQLTFAELPEGTVTFLFSNIEGWPNPASGRTWPWRMPKLIASAFSSIYERNFPWNSQSQPSEL